MSLPFSFLSSRTTVVDGKTLQRFGRVSIGAAIVGLAACRYLHHFGKNDSTAPISLELNEGNLLAWLFIATFGFMVSISLAYQLMHRRWIHALVLVTGLAAIIVIAATNHQTAIHSQALTTAICCLLLSTTMYGLKCGPFVRAVVFSIVFSLTFAIVMLVPTRVVAINIGFAEKSLFVFYAATMVYFLNVEEID